MQLDQFYTPPDVAKKCVSLIPYLDDYDIIVEPSAGRGAFSRLFPNCYAYDLDPQADGIIKQDWLTATPPSGGKMLVVGNPPFGKRGAMAKQFISRAQQVGAMTIAFILPRTFTKLSFQTEAIFPAAWKLIIDYQLEPSNFILPDGNEYHVPCNFMVWTREEANFSPDLRKQRPKPTDDFIFLPRGSKDAIFCINGNNGKVRKVEEITNPKAEHYIGSGTKSVGELLHNFSHLNLTFSPSVSGGNAWVGRNEILSAYNALKNKEV